MEIKPLEWIGPNCGIWEAGKRWTDDKAEYSIIWNMGHRGVNEYNLYRGPERKGKFETLEDAQLIANNWHKLLVKHKLLNEYSE